MYTTFHFFTLNASLSLKIPVLNEFRALLLLFVPLRVRLPSFFAVIGYQWKCVDCQNLPIVQVDLRNHLIHDLCEIYAGDTFVHSPQHGNHEAEQRAVEELFTLLPPDLAETLLDHWKEFTFGNSPEAQFARSLDRLQGLAQNVFSSGRVWKEHGVTEGMIRGAEEMVYVSIDRKDAESVISVHAGTAF